MPRTFSTLHLCCTLVLLGGAGLALAQFSGPEQQSVFGRVDVETPAPTEKGEWHGTWFFVSKNRKMALWFRGPEEAAQVKLRLETMGAIMESLTTDWHGQATYAYRGIPGSFVLTVTEGDANHISGHWDWWLGDEANGRHQTADFNMYRTGDGRTLVMLVTDARTEEFGRRQGVKHVAKQVWAFRKTTRRHARWAELPF